MRYYVIARRWDKEEKRLIKYVAGEFDSFVNAEIFKDAYKKHYCSDAVIAEGLAEFINQ